MLTARPRFHRFALVSLFTLLSSMLAAVGCASPASEPTGGKPGGKTEGKTEESSTEAALTSCTPAKYSAALAHYKDAVAWSKDRLEHGVCQTENGYLESIADAASQAITTCGAFRETIKTSPWAAPIREALGPSLTLRSLTGELLVIKDSQFQNWNGVEALLERGVSFWANAQGAYGSPYQIDLKANGQATWGFLHYDEKSGDISWRTAPATYTVTKVDGTVQGKRVIHVTREGVSESFGLNVDDNSHHTQQAPVFTLTPVDPAQPTQKTLFSMPSECDA